MLHEVVVRHLDGLVDVGFFFSSRRRHTRSKRDWSSDVCSSDLQSLSEITLGSQQQLSDKDCRLQHNGSINGTISDEDGELRSEERRVGKEWRSGGAEGRRKKTKGINQVSDLSNRTSYKHIVY